MPYNTKNYTEQGGDKTVIGGTLEIATGGSITGLAATTSAAGIVKMSAKVAEAAGANPTAAEYKALLDALKAAGIMSST